MVPNTIQHTLDITISGAWWKTFLVYIDDVIIFSDDELEYFMNIYQVLTLLRQPELTFKLKKCHFSKKKILNGLATYWCHALTHDHLSATS